jgi:arylsulfatase A-like enzyme
MRSRDLRPRKSLAEVFKQAGYATACIGKWHLGFVAGMRPLDQGFDSYCGVLHNLDHWETVSFLRTREACPCCAVMPSKSARRSQRK